MDDNTCELNHKNCHTDIKYHMTSSIIFSVVLPITYYNVYGKYPIITMGPNIKKKHEGYIIVGKYYIPTALYDIGGLHYRL